MADSDTNPFRSERGSLSGQFGAGTRADKAGRPWASRMNLEEYQFLKDQGLLQDITSADIGVVTSRTLEGLEVGAATGNVYAAVIGAAVGAVVGAVESVLLNNAIAADAVQELRNRRELEEEFDNAMELRNRLERRLSSFLHPLEQAYKARARAFANQTAAKGLTGASAVAAQLNAERFYREQIGPVLPQIYESALNSSLAERDQAIRALESKYNIILAQEDLDLQRDITTSQNFSAITGGIFSALGSSLGGAFGTSELGLEGQDDVIDGAGDGDAGGVDIPGTINALGSTDLGGGNLGETDLVTNINTEGTV